MAAFFFISIIVAETVSVPFAVGARLRQRNETILHRATSTPQTPTSETTERKPDLTIGLIVPKKQFGVRDYLRGIQEAINSLHKSRGPKLSFLNKYNFTQYQVNTEMMSLTPSPTGKNDVPLLLSRCRSTYNECIERKRIRIFIFIEILGFKMCLRTRFEWSNYKTLLQSIILSS